MIPALRESFVITGLVFVIMLVIEYLNILTKGLWQNKVLKYKMSSYIIGAALGIIPGCLGSFAVVAMYSHGIVTAGVVVANMIATSGDEAFVMLAMIPETAVLLSVLLFILGTAAGIAADKFIYRGRTGIFQYNHQFEIHDEEACICFPRGQFLLQWKECTASRRILAVILVVLIGGIISGNLGPSAWSWVRITFLVITGTALFIVSTVPAHFLDTHLWKHIAMRHVPRIFLWTFGALAAIHYVSKMFDLNNVMSEGKWIVLAIACLVGLIPESGPHLIFVTLFAHGDIPFSILLANSIVQDGHGMLPMLAHSRKIFFEIKIINFIVGILFGALGLVFDI